MNLDLDIYDVIGFSVTARSVRQALNAAKDAKQINLRINSPGGDVVDGAAIFSMLTQHPARVVVDIDGQAASMASFIAMAGSEIRISSVGRMMVHNPWGIAIGEASDLRAQADLLDQTRTVLASVYAVRSGQLATRVLSWMDAETYFNAEQAVANGFADSVTDAAPRARAERNAMQPQTLIPQAVAKAGLTTQYAELARQILTERDPSKLEALLAKRDALLERAGEAPRAAAQGGSRHYYELTNNERADLKRTDPNRFQALRAARDRKLEELANQRSKTRSLDERQELTAQMALWQGTAGVPLEL